MSTDRNSDRVAVITGASSGIGEATARALAADGHRLALLQPDVRVMVIEPRAVATELTDHITHADTKQAVEQMYDAMSITAEDIAQVIAFAISRPQRMTLNEILIRPTGQAL